MVAQLVALGGVPLGPEAAAAAAAGTGRSDRRKAAHPTRRKNHSQARLHMIVMLLHAVDLPCWFCMGEVSNGMHCKESAALAFLLIA